ASVRRSSPSGCKVDSTRPCERSSGAPCLSVPWPAASSARRSVSDPQSSSESSRAGLRSSGFSSRPSGRSAKCPNPRPEGPAKTNPVKKTVLAPRLHRDEGADASKSPEGHEEEPNHPGEQDRPNA